MKKDFRQSTDNGCSALDLAFEWIARASIDAGVDAAEFLKAAKRGLALAGRAASSGEQGGKAPSASRIAALTGLTRKEVPNLLSQAEEQINYRLTPLWTLIREWSESPDFANEDQSPRVLQIRGSKGSFENLAKKVTPDIPYVSLLRELEQMGLVKRYKPNLVALTKSRKHRISDRRAKLEKVSRQFQGASRSAYEATADTPDGILSEQVLIEGVPANLVALFLRDFAGRSKLLLDAVTQWREANIRSQSSNSTKENVGLGVYLLRERNPSTSYSSNRKRKIPSTRRAKRA